MTYTSKVAIKPVAWALVVLGTLLNLGVIAPHVPAAQTATAGILLVLLAGSDFGDIINFEWERKGSARQAITPGFVLFLTVVLVAFGFVVGGIVHAFTHLI